MALASKSCFKGCSLLLLLLVVSWNSQEHPIGYDDTPMLPGQRWRVHDSKRPEPALVKPGLKAQDVPTSPPSDAVILFDGKDLSRWKCDDGSDAKWLVASGAMEINGTGSIETRESFGDCQLHIEWCTPKVVSGDSQGRGNSGIFLMGRYEVQVLDSFQNRTYSDGQASAIYGQYPPLVNACLGPGEWQTYDIVFEAPLFEGEKLVKPARVTVFHNGVLTHHAQEFIGAATHAEVATYSPHPPSGPLMLQDHGNPVRYRNLWIRRLKKYDEK